ncbi:cytochrome BD ubiquinol oxidase subunit II [Nocardiopsis gilva YIM 90087]|uniref:Cytochrome BD ubiquinol oxidase subunit II n=1 Tax=Nocardiopsis gilva YIM 90087 TaxID=1235441 RepID=A0A223RZX9_9ACTN|nr:cytochrome d ubiquinol oxidase subunit II [Nocardiopsis gilva]ASU81440.1 cytochrome BD ubiquinol oxidase subunit II [Nocardiopsis gilva YIM 90087]
METFPVLLLSGLVVGYFVLAGCDIGLGMLMPHLARTPTERRRLVAAIAPYFLGTEVWLVGAFGVVAGLFPALKGVLFEGGLWVVFSVLLAGWLSRDAGVWLRARVDRTGWHSACDTMITAGSWVMGTTWGLVVGGLLAGGNPLSPFGLIGALTVMMLFLLRGAAFGAERLVPRQANGDHGAPSADEAAFLTRLLARIGLGVIVVAAVVALVPGSGLAVDRPFALAVSASVPVAALAATTGLSGPHLSRHTSALALAAIPVVVGAALGLPLHSAPASTLLLTGVAILPILPLMLVGQVALYRMLRRPADEHGFFVSTMPPLSDSPVNR